MEKKAIDRKVENEVERADYTRLKMCMYRAKMGEELTIGFFGGSITQGCSATVHERAYSYRVFEWWKKAFPKAEFHYVNGGIGGTSSHFGVSRVRERRMIKRKIFLRRHMRACCAGFWHGSPNRR